MLLPLVVVDAVSVSVSLLLSLSESVGMEALGNRIELRPLIVLALRAEAVSTVGLPAGRLRYSIAMTAAVDRRRRSAAAAHVAECEKRSSLFVLPFPSLSIWPWVGLPMLVVVKVLLQPILAVKFIWNTMFIGCMNDSLCLFPIMPVCNIPLIFRDQEQPKESTHEK